MRLIGEFTCSDVLLNKLYENVIRSMRGNLLSVPTDCPQRDERLGWTGDITLFGPTAAYLSDCYGKLSRWLGDVAVD
jgi:alpha-L-rhamnosidase